MGGRSSYFNPRSPRGGATGGNAAPKERKNDFNPRSPRGGATTATIELFGPGKISIHAPHEGERRPSPPSQWRGRGISIHAPHEGERRGARRSQRAGSADFNPRSPRGGATRDKCRSGIPCRISIHAPHEGERRMRPPRRGEGENISIHAPHEGERRLRQHVEAAQGIFQSTLPTRGSDIPTSVINDIRNDFNPRSPRGGATPYFWQPQVAEQIFQSTLPTRGSDSV